MASPSAPLVMLEKEKEPQPQPHPQPQNIVNVEDDKDKGANRVNDDNKGKRRSPAWKYFTEVKDCDMGFEKAKCNLCGTEVGCNLIRNFDLLSWWKNNSVKFPILSQIARHVLGMPISNVASEAAFSTGGRTIDTYRSSLNPKTAEALVCTQDWLRSSEKIIDLREAPCEFQHLEKLENDELKLAGKLLEQCIIDD